MKMTRTHPAIPSVPGRARTSAEIGRGLGSSGVELAGFLRSLIADSSEAAARVGPAASSPGLEPEAAGGVTAAAEDGSPSVAARLSILDSLRAEVMRWWSADTKDVEPGDLVRILLALEKVRNGLRESTSMAEGVDDPGLGLLVEMAHDLRSPMTSILTLADALRRGQSGPVNEVQRRQLGLIYSAALGLSGTANNMTELYRSGRFGAEELAPIWIREILESVRNVVQPMAEEKGLEIRLRSTASDQRLGCGLALGRILLNLTTNALKFTERGFIEIAAAPRGPVAVKLSIRDSGPGIDPAAMETLYQPFRRSTACQGYCFSGTGLGLAISRKLVEAMGSQLEVESKLGWGTRFFFTVDLPPAKASRA